MLRKLATALFIASLVPACVGADDAYDGETVKSEDGKADSSSVALFVDFEFDGEMLTDSSWNDKQSIQDQLLYTIGQLNGANSVGRLDRLVLTNVVKTASGSRTKIKYHAKMPVAWGDKQNVPQTFTLKLPMDLGYSAQEAFTNKYKGACVDHGAHDVTSGSMWYYFRPAQSGCSLAAADTLTTVATVSPSPVNTTGKFPEYDKVWADNTLELVAVFGKYEDGATTSADAGIDAYNDFVALIKSQLTGETTIPASIPSSPGVGVPDVEFTASIGGGKKVHVVAMLVDNIREGGTAFNNRYSTLSTRADMIIYNGHAALGENVRWLANHGSWTQGQYLIMFMNGCDTFAYVDDALFTSHAAVNPDDPNGTKYQDLVLNAMPSYFANMAGASMSLLRGLLSFEAPKTYEQIFREISSTQVVMVTGESDNTFTPGGGGTPTPSWPGLTASGTIKKNIQKRWTTPILPAGTYTFEMTGTDDADLYVRIGSKPTTTTYDCRPYKTGSNEICDVTIAQPAPIHVMVRGYSTTSDFELAGRAVE